MTLFRLSPELSRHESDQPSATPAEAVPPMAGSLDTEVRVHGSSVSLSEAFLDTSSFDRIRASLPEQHRTHLDELRQGILAFCKEFGIPVETLRSKEAFGVELTSKRIPPERMAHAVSLFARLEYLVTNREPLKIEFEALKEVEPLYHLTEQYNTQIALLERVGILKDGAITGIDGNKYHIPTLEQIAARLYERKEELSTKRDQGFTKLLLVPFGMSLDILRETLKQFLLTYQQTHPAFDLDTNEPLWTWEKGYNGADTGNPPKIVYNPKSFDGNHQGLTKLQILEEQKTLNQVQGDKGCAGWRIHLLQPQDSSDSTSKGFAFIPRQGQGKTQGKETPRRDLEAGKFPNDYLSILQEVQDDPASPYYNESGLTPEDWILAFMTHLTETGEPLDDFESSKESITYLTGAFFPSIDGSALVPYASWRRVFRQACLGVSVPRSRFGYIGVRSAVVI